MLLAYSRRSDGEEHAVLRPKAGNRLNCWRLIKKDRGRFLLLIWGKRGGGGRNKIECPILF